MILFGRFISVLIALLLILVGTVLLLNNLGILFIDVVDLLEVYWPVVLILIGLYFIFARFGSGNRSNEISKRVFLTEGLEGAAKADIKIDFGAGSLDIKPLPKSGVLFEGSFIVRPGVAITKVAGAVSMALKQVEWPWIEPVAHAYADDWRIGLTTYAILNLTLNTGASKVLVDLKDNDVESLALNTGASDVTIRLSSVSKATRVMIAGGAANIRIEIPAGVAARIVPAIAPALINIDSNRFPKSGSQYISTGFDSAAHRAEIEIKAGLSQITIL